MSVTARFKLPDGRTGKVTGESKEAVLASIEELENTSAQTPQPDRTIGTGEQVPQSPFPDEPGTSRAAQELPELVETGVRNVIPDAPVPTQLGQSAAALTMTDPNEIAQMLGQHPDVGIQYASDGTIIAANNKTNVRTVLNKPGLSAMDAAQVLGIGTAFSGAGKAASLSGNLVPRAIGAMAASGATETVLQAGQEAAGGTFNRPDILASTGFGMLPEVTMRPLIGMFNKAREIFGPRRKILGNSIDDALNFVQEAREVLPSGRPAILTTSNLNEGKITTPVRTTLQVAERSPFGTSGAKITQQEQRKFLVENQLTEEGVDLSTDYGREVMKRFSKNRDAALDSAMVAKSEAIKLLERDGQGVPLTRAIEAAEDIINKQLALGSSGDPAVVKHMQNLIGDFSEGRTFGNIVEIRTHLNRKISKAGFTELYTPAVDKEVKAVALSMRTDMNEFAKLMSKDNPGAFQAWKKYNRIFADDLTNVKDTVLGKMIRNSGKEVTADLADRVIRSNNPKLLGELFRRSGKKGQTALRRDILKDIAIDAGGTANSLENLSVSKFLSKMESKKYAARLEGYFPIGSQLDGLKQYLKLTDTKLIDVNFASSGGLGSTIAGFTGIPQMLGRSFESPVVRNLYSRLARAEGNARLTERVMRKLGPLVIASARQEADVDVPEIPNPLSEEQEEFLTNPSI